MATRLQLAKSEIVAHFNAGKRRVYRLADLALQLSINRERWRLAQRATVTSFVEFLIKRSKLRRVNLDFGSRRELRFTWGEATPYEVALSLNSKAYLSHLTALALYELTEQIPKTIYVNIEQGPKPPPAGGMTQTALDSAFRRPPRRSSRVATLGDVNLTVLSGKDTDRLGVVQLAGPDNARLDVTDLERTLIDAAVRPHYAGGPHEVLHAYQVAQERVSVNRLVAYLRKLDYVYPYHQAIGFYMDRAANYRPAQLDLLREFPFEFDFYLAHGLKEHEYDAKWRLFHPAGM